MSWFLLLTPVHVIAALTAVGANPTYGAKSALGRHDVAAARFAHEGSHWSTGRIAGPAYAAVVLTRTAGGRSRAVRARAPDAHSEAVGRASAGFRLMTDRWSNLTGHLFESRIHLLPPGPGRRWRVARVESLGPGAPCTLTLEEWRRLSAKAHNTWGLVNQVFGPAFAG